MNVTYFGETYPFKGTFKNEDGELFDPDSHLIKLIDPEDDEISENTSPTKESTGVFTASFNIPLNGKEGVWIIVWIISKNGEIDKEKHLFKVRSTD